MELTGEQVLAAVTSLYDDRLKPYGRILLRRLGEHAVACSGGEPEPSIDTRHLREICEDHPRLAVYEEQGREYFVTLIGRRADFVDPNQLESDPYPQDMWDALTAYFSEGGAGYNTPGLPGGRYSCARALAELGLPTLGGRSLGELSHIVALAIGKRRILGYSKLTEAKGSVTVPFCRSDVGIKTSLAERGERACHLGITSNETLQVASWREVRECLSELLGCSGQQNSTPIPVPNVKRLFLSQYSLELSETALGHSRLQDLLQDDRLQDICKLRRQDGVHLVERATCTTATAQEFPHLPLLSTTPQTTEVFAPSAALPDSDRAPGFAPFSVAPAISPGVCGTTGVLTTILNEKFQESPWVDTSCSDPSAASSSIAFVAACSPSIVQNKFLESPWLVQESSSAGVASIAHNSASGSNRARFSSLMSAEDDVEVEEVVLEGMHVRCQTKNTFVQFDQSCQSAGRRHQSLPPNMKLAQ